MKICVTICFLLLNLVLTAQNYYYNVTKTFNENGYAYQCDVLEGSGFVTLYNKENKFTHVDQVDRNTGESISIRENKERLFEDDSWTKPKCFSIINNAFSYAEKQRVRGRDFTIIMYISPDTGKVIGVEYQFTSMNPYATIPVSVFRKIEVELKKKYLVYSYNRREKTKLYYTRMET